MYFWASASGLAVQVTVLVTLRLLYGGPAL